VIRCVTGLLVGLLVLASTPTVRADEIKRALFVLGIHMGGAEGVAVGFAGKPTKDHPGAMALMQRNLRWSIDVADALKLPSTGLKALLDDVEKDKVSFADMAKRLGAMRLETQASAAKSINPGAGAFYIMGVHESGGEGLALGAKDFRREDKPGTSALIARQLKWLTEGTDTIKVSKKTVLDIQDAFDKGDSFADLAGRFEKLRLKWQDELGAQPGFGAAAGKVLLSTAGKLTDTDPKDRVRTGSYAKVHVMTLKKGQTIVIDLESGDGNPIPKPGFFDTWLRVEDSTGKQLAYNDDISSSNYNSRLAFTAPADGDYRLIVTSYRAGATGAYVLTVRAK
jgi:hypothetical protein